MAVPGALFPGWERAVFTRPGPVEEGDMGRVKGTILIDFVKTIKADRSGAYAPFLTPQDQAVIAGRILPSGWYPYETFTHCFNAVVTVLAKRDMEAVRHWGRLYGENILTGFYKGMLRAGAPMDSLLKYQNHIRNLFDFGEIEVEPLKQTQALIKITGFDLKFEPQYHMMRGWIERSLEICGALDISCEFVEKSWQGDPQTSLKFSWKESGSLNLKH